VIVVANLQGLTPPPPWLGEEASQEQPRPVVEVPILSPHKSHLNSGGNAGGSSDHRGENNRRNTPTMADMPRGYGEVTSQGQLQPVSVSRIRSSQRADTNSGGDAGGNSGHRGGSDLYSTTTRADDVPVLGGATLKEGSQLAVISPIRSSQRSVINTGGDAGGSSGYRGGSDRYGTPTRTDKLPMARRRSIARTAQTSRGITYTFETEELSILGGKRWWEQR
jgi:hypothetical protein